MSRMGTASTQGTRVSRRRSRCRKRRLASGSTKSPLLEFGEFGPGSLENRDIGVGVLPEGEKVLVRLPSLVVVSKQRVGPAQLQMRERTHGIVDHYAAMVENALEFGCGLCALPRCEISFAAQVR